MEVIPAIDLIDGRCVRLVQGDYSRETVYSDDPVEVALRWESMGADSDRSTEHTMEVIPAIDLIDGRCVRLVQGDYSRETVYSDDPVEVALRWKARGLESRLTWKW